ncbi:hypothetical protein J7L68_07760, partial [bacterium]|nr:hypothetical protein [bacterium]
MRAKKLAMLGSLTALFVIIVFVASCQIMPSGPDESENVSIEPNTPLFADDGITFTPHDHTLIIKAIGDNMLGDYGVIAHLENRDNFTGSDVLRAALEVESIPDSVKKKIQVVLKYAPALEQAEKEIPADLQARLDEIKSKLEQATSPEDVIVILRELKESGKYDDIKGIDKAFEFGMAIVQDGMGSIYSADYDAGYAHICQNENNNGDGGDGLPEPDTSGQDSTGHNEPDTTHCIDITELAFTDAAGAALGCVLTVVESIISGGAAVVSIGLNIFGGAGGGSATNLINQYIHRNDD